MGWVPQGSFGAGRGHCNQCGDCGEDELLDGRHRVGIEGGKV